MRFFILFSLLSCGCARVLTEYKAGKALVKELARDVEKESKKVEKKAKKKIKNKTCWIQKNFLGAGVTQYCKEEK